MRCSPCPYANIQGLLLTMVAERTHLQKGSILHLPEWPLLDLEAIVWVMASESLLIYTDSANPQMHGKGKLYSVKLNYSSIWTPPEGVESWVGKWRFSSLSVRFQLSHHPQIGRISDPSQAHSQISQQLSQIRLAGPNKHGWWRQLVLWQSVSQD